MPSNHNPSSFFFTKKLKQLRIQLLNKLNP
ncbi:hypothetical protein F383_38897 [Gossypium arboreum]|uniref:Uncharacterized protein n=1 Tax=Gossypium arboreum TaxID=29729 RepID=A0A0B0MHZ2_GOSAR|nr:hypothetical protein F383_38897 [Gossypium arboreum]